jgi:poly-gamma-glutamate capsule biosynthesis protein CapA/YwtB (metallophosphatase superfamily)
VRDELVALFLCGDVMLGRGVDQILPNAGDPSLRESFVRDARSYVALAEAANGSIPRPVDFSWPWGDALQVLDEAAPDARVLNLETTVTRSNQFAARKAVHYRMHPANLPCLAAAMPDVCVLANNHVLDFGYQGLDETLAALSASGLPAAGAGRDVSEAQRPAAVSVAGDRRVLVVSFGMASSGIPREWAATGDRPGVNFVSEPSDRAAAHVVDQVRQAKQPGDLVVASIHWASNWGYHVPADEVRYAHRLIDGGVDVVHGHSSHHPRPVEVYRGKLILYGCGDFIDDYEGIAGHAEYRPDLRLLYLASVDPQTGRLIALQMVPMQARRMRLRHATGEDAEWLRALLDRLSRPFGARVGLEPNRALTLRPG